MPIAFLTGGTGFVGGHVARALIEQGWNVRLLARDPAKGKEGLLEGLAVEVVKGDLGDTEGLARAVAGADAIVHVAGLTKARTLAEYRDVNVGGTERLLTAASRTAPGALFLLVSSQAAAGPSRGGQPVRDSDPAQPISWYGISKREGEQAVERLWKGPRITLRPGVIYGPGDRGLFAYFKMAASGWVPVPAGSTRIQLIGARQAALAIARASARRDLSGRTGFLSEPEPVTVRRLVSAIAGLSGGKTRLFPVPGAALWALGAAESVVEGLTRRSRPFNADKAREILAGDWLCDSSPMRAALELPASKPLGEGLRETWDWYRRAGWLPGTNL